MPQINTAIDDRSDPQWFATTHWSVVISAGQSASSHSAGAVESLCRTYWQPLYSFTRKQGFSPADAQDLTQAFFAKLLEKNFWARADRQKGRFRTLLLIALRHFLSDAREWARAAKRGGGIAPISLDEQNGDDRLSDRLGQPITGEQEFDRQWATAILERAREQLRCECILTGKARLFEHASMVDGPREHSARYATIAQELGLTISALKSAISRLRKRYGELVREEVKRTVSDPSQVADEIRHLIAVVSN